MVFYSNGPRMKKIVVMHGVGRGRGADVSCPHRHKMNRPLITSLIYKHEDYFLLLHRWRYEPTIDI
jgi:hypothetical protein